MSERQQAIIVADLGFGDAGKGTVIDALTRKHKAHIIVRYNGGPQAAHNVVTPDGRHHTFAQFGSGMFLPWTRTLLSRFMLINPLNMLSEARHLRELGVTDAFARTLIDRHALVITPFQRSLNRLRELARADARHGSCGEGIGECMADALAHEDAVLRFGDLQDRATTIKKLRWLRDLKYPAFAAITHQLCDSEAARRECKIFVDSRSLEDCVDVFTYLARQVRVVDEEHMRTVFDQPGTLLFEGAQGVLLDENYGFAPYTTWSTTTFANVETIMRQCDYQGEVRKLGVLRAYATRHGAGPFPSEDETLTAALPEPHNSWNDWQHAFRTGYFDLVMTRYALDIAGRPDSLAVTHLDRLKMLPAWKVCHAYTYRGQQRDASNFFACEGDNVTRLKVHTPLDLTHQEGLTERLWSCTPRYEEFLPVTKASTVDWTAYVSCLEQQLAIPVSLISYGMTAREKRFSLEVG